MARRRRWLAARHESDASLARVALSRVSRLSALTQSWGGAKRARDSLADLRRGLADVGALGHRFDLVHRLHRASLVVGADALEPNVVQPRLVGAVVVGHEERQARHVLEFAELRRVLEHAERIEPGFYPKNLLLTAQALSRLGRADEAKAALAKCLAATPKSPEDEATLEEARKLKL